jgi:hypothetical protein
MTQRRSKATEKTEKKATRDARGVAWISFGRSALYSIPVFYSLLCVKYYLFICLTVRQGEAFTDAAGSN